MCAFVVCIYVIGVLVYWCVGIGIEAHWCIGAYQLTIGEGMIILRLRGDDIIRCCPFITLWEGGE